MIQIAAPIIGEEEIRNVMKVLHSGMLAQGPYVRQLEEEFAKLCGTKYAVAVNSGTAALHTSLYASGIRPGDEVITVPFTFVASANSIIMQGAKPIFVDVDENTFNINPKLIEEKITPNTKAILPVHLYGQPCDMGSIRKIAKRNDLKVIEDSAQAVGAEIDGQKTGNLGDLAAFSFYATKNMITGEGGIITTNNEQFAEFARRFRHHGQSEKTRYEYYDLGFNYRMMDIQAAIGLAQLNKVEKLTQKRIFNAHKLSKGLKDIQEIETPFVKDNVKHVFHQYTIKVKDSRDKLREHLKNKGIGTGIYYPKPLHLHPFFAALDYKKGDFPVSEKLSEQVLSLPVHPLVSEADIENIINVLRKYK